jgi:hypothetical protein
MTGKEPGEEAVQAAAEVMLRHYDREYSSAHLTWRDFADDAREILQAAHRAQGARRRRMAGEPPADRARQLLEEALHLGMHGERAPGGNETWAEWHRKNEAYLRSLMPGDGGPLPLSAANQARLRGLAAEPIFQPEEAQAVPASVASETRMQPPLARMVLDFHGNHRLAHRFYWWASQGDMWSRFAAQPEAPGEELM